MSQPFLQSYAGKEKIVGQGFSSLKLNSKYSNIMIIASTIDPNFFQMPFKHRITKLGYYNNPSKNNLLRRMGSSPP